MSKKNVSTNTAPKSPAPASAKTSAQSPAKPPAPAQKWSPKAPEIQPSKEGVEEKGKEIGTKKGGKQDPTPEEIAFCKAKYTNLEDFAQFTRLLGAYYDKKPIAYAGDVKSLGYAPFDDTTPTSHTAECNLERALGRRVDYRLYKEEKVNRRIKEYFILKYKLILCEMRARSITLNSINAANLAVKNRVESVLGQTKTEWLSENFNDLLKLRQAVQKKDKAISFLLQMVKRLVSLVKSKNMRAKAEEKKDDPDKDDSISEKHNLVSSDKLKSNQVVSATTLSDKKVVSANIETGNQVVSSTTLSDKKVVSANIETGNQSVSATDSPDVSSVLSSKSGSLNDLTTENLVSSTKVTRTVSSNDPSQVSVNTTPLELNKDQFDQLTQSLVNSFTQTIWHPYADLSSLLDNTKLAISKDIKDHMNQMDTTIKTSLSGALGLFQRKDEINIEPIALGLSKLIKEENPLTSGIYDCFLRKDPSTNTLGDLGKQTEVLKEQFIKLEQQTTKLVQEADMKFTKMNSANERMLKVEAEKVSTSLQFKVKEGLSQCTNKLTNLEEQTQKLVGTKVSKLQKEIDELTERTNLLGNANLLAEKIEKKIQDIEESTTELKEVVSKIPEIAEETNFLKEKIIETLSCKNQISEVKIKTEELEQATIAEKLLQVELANKKIEAKQIRDRNKLENKQQKEEKMSNRIELVVNKHLGFKKNDYYKAKNLSESLKEAVKTAEVKEKNLNTDFDNKLMSIKENMQEIVEKVDLYQAKASYNLRRVNHQIFKGEVEETSPGKGTREISEVDEVWAKEFENSLINPVKLRERGNVSPVEYKEITHLFTDVEVQLQKNWNWRILINKNFGRKGVRKS